MFEELYKASMKYFTKEPQIGEFNLLPIFPILDRNPGNLACLHIISEEETIGVNNMEEAEVLSTILRNRKNEVFKSE